MDPNELRRLTTVHELGARVRAVRPIFFATSGREVAEGARGDVVGKTQVPAVVVVRWHDVFGFFDETTSAENLEPWGKR